MIIKGFSLKKIYTMAGSFFVFLGVVGIFLPIVPTVPFLVVALFCYNRGSKRHYNWLIRNKVFGKYIKDYNEGRGIPVYGKIMGILALWISIVFSSTFIIENNILRIILFIVALGVSVHIAKIKTLRQSKI